MSREVPLYSRHHVDVAGRTLVTPSASDEDREHALVVVNNWRAAHDYPLNTFQATLRWKAKSVYPSALVAQRIKRLTSIRAKLERFERMNLSRMQDLGGARAVMSSVPQVRRLARNYSESSFKHVLLRETDYIENPQASGYRGIHLIYGYRNPLRPEYDGLQIELQFRSRRMHAWATAVEIVGTFTQQALKSSQGEADWLRFFALMGTAIARQERTPSFRTRRLPRRRSSPSYVPAMSSSASGEYLTATVLGYGLPRIFKAYLRIRITFSWCSTLRAGPSASVAIRRFAYQPHRSPIKSRSATSLIARMSTPCWSQFNPSNRCGGPTQTTFSTRTVSSGFFALSLARVAYPDLVTKQEPTEQYTPKGAKIPIPDKGEFRRNLDKLIQAEQPAPKARRTAPPKPD